MLSNSGRFRDRNPGYTAAGKLFGLKGTAKECLEIPLKPQTPDQVHKFRCTFQPAVGRSRIFYGRYNDPNIANILTHGVSTKPSYIAGQLVNPDPKSFFSYRLNQKREESVYASRKRAPLGKSHDQKEGLPAGVSPFDKRYGLPTLRYHSAAELVNPLKSRKKVEEESAKGIELYKKSHNAYNVGESYNRKYDWSRVPETSCFGVETPHDNRGLHTKKSLKWLYETQSEKTTQLTSKRVDEFRERNIPQVGMVHDPIKETLNYDPDNTFGVMVKPDEYGAGDLIHMRSKTNFLRGRDRVRGILAAVRQNLKKANYQNFRDLKEAFRFYDKDESGYIDLAELKAICIQFNLPVQTELLELLLESCDKNKDKKIDYVEFANFLNWKDKTTTGLLNGECKVSDWKADQEYEKKVIECAQASGINVDSEGITEAELLRKQLDHAHEDQNITSSLFNSVKDFSKARRTYGIPTIRSDLPAPRIKSIGDNTNYGDESDAYGLINPSLYSNYGVYEEDFFKERDPATMKRVLDSIGVEMTNDVFQDLWEKARKNSPNGQVSVESFRSILDEKVSEEFEKSPNNKKDPDDVRAMIERMTLSKPKHYQQIHEVKRPEQVAVG